MDLFDDEMFEVEEEQPRQRPPRRPPRRRRRAGMRGETAKRILVAIPWIVFAIAIVVAGGVYFALATSRHRSARSEAPLAARELLERLLEGRPREVGPELVAEDQLGVRALPEQVVGDSPLAAGADQ
jgi:hypothetical protein